MLNSTADLSKLPRGASPETPSGAVTSGDILIRKVLPALSRLSLNSASGSTSLFSPERQPEATGAADRGQRAAGAGRPTPAATGGARSEASRGRRASCAAGSLSVRRSQHFPDPASDTPPAHASTPLLQATEATTPQIPGDNRAYIRGGCVPADTDRVHVSLSLLSPTGVTLNQSPHLLGPSPKSISNLFLVRALD